MVATAIVVAVVTIATIAVTRYRDSAPTISPSIPTVVETSTVEPSIVDTTVAESTPSVAPVVSAPIDDPPLWYRDIVNFLPSRFDHVALTFVSDGSVRYLAIDVHSGKGLDIEIRGPLSAPATNATTGSGVATSLDRPYSHEATGATGVHVEVTCGIGAGRIGDDAIKDTDYCAMPSTGSVSSGTLQTMVEAMADRFPAGHLAPIIGEPSQASIDVGQLDAITADALKLPSLTPVSDVAALTPADQFLGYGTSPPTAAGQPGYDAHDDATVRVVERIYPPPDAVIGGQMALYENLAAGWVINPAGTAIRITTASDPTTVAAANALFARLAALPLKPSAVASTPSTTGPTFTPVTLGSPPAGYTLAWAHYQPDPPGGDVGVAVYDSPQDATQLQVIIRDIADFFEPPLGLGRQTWQVDGRTIVNDSQGETCTPSSCSVGVQWDERTAISISWEVITGGSLGPDQTLNSLVDLAKSLSVDATAWRPGSLRPGTLSFDVQGIDTLAPVVVAEFDSTFSVSRDDGTDAGIDVIKYIPARIALAAPNGRIIIEQTGALAPIVATEDEPNMPPYNPLWPHNPIAGPVRIHDIAVVNTVTTLLYSVDDTVYTTPIDDPTAATLIKSGVQGLTGQARLHLTNDGSILGATGDTASALFTANTNHPTYFDLAAPTTGSRLFAIESSGTHVAWLHGSTITIADSSGTTKDFPVPYGIDGADVVGLDLATSDEPTDNGMIAVSYTDHNATVIDISDGSITDLGENTIGLATLR